VAERVGLAEDLAAQWASFIAAAGLGEAEAVGVKLLAAYNEPHRRYHGLAHIKFLLDEIARRAPHLSETPLVTFAAWFHDAIYDPMAKDNEERSAEWARSELAAIGLPAARCDAVASLILKTKSHHSGHATSDEALFLDMDFAILGAETDIYATYAANVRAEYAAVPDPAFRTGRAAFLKSVLDQPRMFRTALYEDECGARARENIAWEIARLDSGAPLV
jgi:predicted metal-dependent HD superfamily phosphohydrolase